MPLLAQQELLTPPPRSRIIVHHGAVCHWGVDPASVRISIACAHPDGTRYVTTTSFPTIPTGPRLAAIHRETRDVARALAVTFPPGVILIEQPSGRVVNHELGFAVGVIMAAVYEGVTGTLGHGVEIRTVTSSWWKKRATGKGNLSKPTRKSLGRTPTFEDYGVAAWARENGYRGASWDEADAWGICEAARRDIALEER